MMMMGKCTSRWKVVVVFLAFLACRHFGFCADWCVSVFQCYCAQPLMTCYVDLRRVMKKVIQLGK